MTNNFCGIFSYEIINSSHGGVVVFVWCKLLEQVGNYKAGSEFDDIEFHLSEGILSLTNSKETFHVSVKVGPTYLCNPKIQNSKHW